MKLSSLPVIGSHSGAPQKPVRGSTKRARRTKRSGRWKVWRDAVWAASEGICAECSRSVIRTDDIFAENAGHADHIKPRGSHPELRFDPANGQILCSKHHFEKHGQRR